MARTHLKELCNHYLQLFNDNLRTTLNLKGVYKGDLTFFPAQALTDMVNGIFVNPLNVRIERVLLPKELETTYIFRFLYIKRIAQGTNVVESKIDDCTTIQEHLFDKYQLPDLTLTNGQVLWSLPNEIDMNPPEDEYVAILAADMVAMAFIVDCKVRSKR